jgi:sugar lactone lactonase YvrE
MPRPPMQPVVWIPPAIPERARRIGGDVPLPGLRLLDVIGHGPEDVVVDAGGSILTGVDDGRILRLAPDGRRVETVADTGGRPLGLELLPDGGVLVCDARRGLLRVDAGSGAVEPLVVTVEGEPMLFCNNAAVAADGTVYFSDSSRRFGIDHWKGDLMEHSGTGRLLRRDPDGQVEVLLQGLQFANGVALAPDGSSVLVAESGAYRITRLALTGPDAGRSAVLVDNLPGFPDNLSTGSDGLVWVALGSARQRSLDMLHPRHPALRRMAWSLPDRLQLHPRRSVWTMALDWAGQVVHDLQGQHPTFYMVTGVREDRGTVYLGSLRGRAIAAFDLAGG